MARVRGCDVWSSREDESVCGGGVSMWCCDVVDKAVLVVRDLLGAAVMVSLGVYAIKRAARSDPAPGSATLALETLVH
jgi:hypothetical protein